MLYADDFAARTSVKRLELAETNLNLALKTVKSYADNWGVEFDPNKSKVIVFCHGNKYNAAGLF